MRSSLAMRRSWFSFLPSKLTPRATSSVGSITTTTGAVMDAANNNNGIEDLVRSFLIDKCQVHPNAYILLSVSGGVDSMAMLHLLSAVGSPSGSVPLNIEVVSFNHKLRPESDEEITFVASWALKYGFLFHERTLPEEQRSLAGFQARARDWRRNESLAIVEAKKQSSERTRNGLAVYATAHHADDQLETTMLKLLRGAFISNLQPISARSDCGRVIRPLLPLSKNQIESYMLRNGFDWREDSSNEERKYKRNKVRLDVIPAMETVTGGNASLRKRFEALAEQSADLEQWLDREAVSFLTIHHAEVLQQSPSMVDGGDEFSPLLSLDVQKGSAFAQLPSSLVQMEVLRRLCHHCSFIREDSSDLAELSVSRGLNYDMTKKLLALAIVDLPLGVKEKKLQLLNDLFAVKVGTQLVFERAPVWGQRKQGVDKSVDKSMPTVEVMCGQVTVRALAGMKVTVVPIPEIDSSPTCRSSTHTPPHSPAHSPVHSSGHSPTAHGAPFVMTPTTNTDDRPRGQGVSVDIWNIPQNATLTIRYPMNGDRFLPPTKLSPLRVVEYLRHAAVPLHLRSSVPVIVLEGNANTIVSIPPHVAPPYMNRPIEPNSTDDHLHMTSIRITLTR